MSGSFIDRSVGRNLRSVLLLGAASAATLGLAAPAFAQDAATETVVVTGSRIPQQGLYSTSPVSSVGQQEFKLQGTTSVGQTLRSLPSTVEDGDGNTVDNGTAGIATVDLRNLGVKRTLVLVDGKRLVPADPTGEVDTNQIPAQMVDHVEVLTGGASAEYGSDAVSGVVNIILRKDFQGMEVDGQYSESDHGDAGITDTSAVLGFNSADGKGNVTIYGEYNHRDAVPESSRDYGAHALATTNFTGCASPATHFGGFCFSGSGTVPQGRIKSAALGGFDPNGGGFLGAGGECATVASPTAACTTIFQPDGTLTKYNGQTFNFAPYQFYQTEGTRYAFGGTGHYDINSHLNFYTRLTFSDNQSTSQLGPSPLSSNFSINCGNALMSAQEREVIFGTTTTAGTIAAQCATAGDTATTQRLVSMALRLTAVGPRITDEDHTAYQMVFGTRGDLAWGWTYDMSAQYGHTIQGIHLTNDASRSRFQSDLLVNPDGTCETAGCVPINIFADGGITNTMADNIRLNMTAISHTDQWDVQGFTQGDFGALGLKSPFAKTPVAGVFGFEYRQEAAAFEPDDNLATNNLVGFEAIEPSHGRYDVKEGFSELRVPIAEGMPFFQLLQFEGQYRYSSYNRSGAVSSYKYGGEWAPTDDFRLRASVERSVRAPNIAELFTPPGSQAASSAIDPCSAAATGLIHTTALLCQQTGVPSGSAFTTTLNCPTNQCQASIGGNPFLKPEISDTKTAGIVLTPTFIDGLTATVDYYDIKISGFIEATPITTILTNCYSTAVNVTQSALNPFCSFVHRDVLGQIDTNTGFVVSAEGNIAFDRVRGFDFEVNYQTDLANFGLKDMGSIGMNYVSTLVRANDFQPLAGAGVIHCAGLWGPTCGEPQNRYKSNLRTTWYSPSDDISVSLRWRYLSSAAVDIQPLSGRTTTTPCGFNACYVLNPSQTPSGTIPAYNYFDLSGTYAVSDGIELRAGVSNIFAKKPPLIDNNAAPVADVNGNTFPNTYDSLGRIIFLGGTVKF
ncbi:MAG TPA: TonB-dependent receptor [Rhizomicrobium sp.]|jgi:outer membrane receptor protein involved in Fe transport